MKRVIAVILVCVMVLATNCIVAFGEEMPKSVEEVKEYNIIKGDPDGNMRLSDNLTRAEAVTLIVRAYGFTPETSLVAPANEFSDMEGHWACNAAMIAKALKVIDETDVFAPDENINSEEFIKMIISLLGYKEEAEQRGGYPMGYLMKASQLGVTKGVSIATGQYITREDAVKLICNSLDVPLMVVTSYGETIEYAIMDGKNGHIYQTLRTMFDVE